MGDARIGVEGLSRSIQVSPVAKQGSSLRRVSPHPCDSQHGVRMRKGAACNHRAYFWQANSTCDWAAQMRKGQLVSYQSRQERSKHLVVQQHI